MKFGLKIVFEKPTCESLLKLRWKFRVN